MEPDIQRIDTYDDGRFSSEALRQHGAFLGNGEPYEVKITSVDCAQIQGASPELYGDVIECFRFYAGHISRFYNISGDLVREYPPAELFSVKLCDIQPSQFYVDEEKLAAVRTFIRCPEDIVIPVTPDGERYISRDGHTRLAAAIKMGFDKVKAFIAPGDEVLSGFADEARKRGIMSPYDLQIISHEEYEVKWDQFCDEFLREEMSENDTICPSG